jgi:streptogrisin C
LVVGFLLLNVGVANAGTVSSQAHVVRGGDPFFAASARCTIGAAVRGGFITAGSCGPVGASTVGHNQVAQGVIQGSTFPGISMAWVSVNADWIPRGVVGGAAGSEILVRGSDEAPVGSTVCRSGSTTGWRCGTLVRRNVTLNYPQGVIYGLIETNICAEPGDRGGPLMWNGHVQGILVAANGNCSVGGRSFYQPIRPILQSYGLTLLTS